MICYGHKLLTQSQRRYCTTQRELLALVFFLSKYRQYLDGSKTLVRVDHSALRWLRRAADGSSMLQRWSTILDECGVEVPNNDLCGYLETFQYDVTYRPGERHGNADAMSRRPVARCHATCPTCAPEAARAADGCVDGGKQDVVTRGVAAVSVVSPDGGDDQESDKKTVPKPGAGLCAAVRPAVGLESDGCQTFERWQDADQAIVELKRRLCNNEERPARQEVADWSSWQLGLLAQWDALSLNGDRLLCRLSKSGVSQLVVPQALVGDVLKLNHDCVGVNHEGVAKTYGRVKQRYYWPRMFADISSRHW